MYKYLQYVNTVLVRTLRANVSLSLRMNNFSNDYCEDYTYTWFTYFFMSI